MVKKILFICKHNIFRSRVGEEYLKKINPNVKVSGAGIIMGDTIPQVTLDSAKEYGLDISYNPRPLSIELLREQDIIIVVASDVPEELFNNPLYEATNKVRFWNIDDVKNLFTPSDENNKEIIEKIIKKVDELNKELIG
jgi:protein-tyrosine-phosphatase